LLAAMSEPDRIAFLRRRPAEDTPLIEQLLADFDEIRQTRLARNTLHGGARSAIATTVRNRDGDVVAEVTLVGPTSQIAPKAKKLGRTLLEHVDRWQTRVSSGGPI
jgi:DNA-binding IclR family transcriptional regulator